MDMLTFWKMMKDGRITDQTVTLASINRLFYQGVKNRYTVSQQEDSIKAQIEMAKKLGRPLTHEELRDIAILNLVSNISSSDTSKIDYSVSIYEDQSQSEKLFIDAVNLHAADRVILFRHFVELIVRVSFLKYGDILNLHRSLEKFLVNKITPIFEPKKIASGKSMTHIEDTEAGAQKKYFLIQHYKDIFVAVFNLLSKDNKNERFGMTDRTCKFKDVLKFLQECELIVTDVDKKAFIVNFEKSFDVTSTSAYVDQMAKDKEKEDKDKEKNSQNNKKKKPTKAAAEQAK